MWDFNFRAIRELPLRIKGGSWGLHGMLDWIKGERLGTVVSQESHIPRAEKRRAMGNGHKNCCMGVTENIM